MQLSENARISKQFIINIKRKKVNSQTNAVDESKEEHRSWSNSSISGQTSKKSVMIQRKNRVDVESKLLLSQNYIFPEDFSPMSYKQLSYLPITKSGELLIS